MNENLKIQYEIFSKLLPFEYKYKYKEQFIKSCDNGLYDYAIILLWKTFMLIQYKNIRHNRIILGDQVFETIWSKGSLSDSKIKLNDFNINNIYAYNKIDDNKILDLLGRIYDIDGNLIKKLKSWSGQRAICAHVADEILLADG